jgi:hypothetical protein
MILTQYKNSLILSLLVSASAVAANETEDDKLKLSGFATLGAAYTDSEHHGYRKNVGSDSSVLTGEIDFKQHSLLGFQADWSISPSFDIVYQGVLRDLPKPSLDRYTTLAFLRYEVNMNWSVRVGRTAPDLFLLTEFRDIDFAYPWATAPSEVYGIIPFRSIDGIDVIYSQRGLNGTFKTKLFTGSGESEISGSSVVEQVNIEDVIGVSLSFDHFNWRVQAKRTQLTLANEPESNTLLIDYIHQVPDFLWPNSSIFTQSLLMTGKKVNYSSLSGEYHWRNWQVSTEWSQINSKSRVIPKITSGYTALSYKVNAHQFYSIYAFTKSKTYVFDEPGVDETLLGELIHSTIGLMNFYSANQQTISLGWRWDITNDMAASLQWNHTTLSEETSILWLNQSDHNEAEKVNSFLLNLSMVF